MYPQSEAKDLAGEAISTVFWAIPGVKGHWVQCIEAGFVSWAMSSPGIQCVATEKVHR